MEEKRDVTNADPGSKDRADDSEDTAAVHPTKDEDQKEGERDETVDEAADDSFPSSDAPSW